MLSFIRKQLSATNLMVVAALIFAMAGGAYAANGGGGHHGHHGHVAKHKGKKAKKGGKRGPRGPRGKTGPEGKAGATGPAGPAGPAGKSGTNGKDGTNGTNGASGKEGAAGKGVAVSTTAVGCKAGGLTVEVEGSGAPQEVCNGEPGVYPETLPAGATETGTWVLTPLAKATTLFGLNVPVIFSMPLPAPIEEANVHIIEEEETPPTGCSGTMEEPAAEPGNMCLWVAKNSSKLKAGELALVDPESGGLGAGMKSAQLTSLATEEGATGFGTWAVTAEL